MPYLRLYARGLPTEQKRVVAQKLIEITLRTFHLRADQRYQTSVQFITLPQPSGVDEPQAEGPREGDFTLEVIGHNLTEEKKRAFAKEAAAMLAHVTPMKRWNRIARALGIKAKQPQEICLLFNELSPAVSDPFVLDAQQYAA
jgi:phenylpyruvate tautomerase PptA (4-oxalocrotonate tautomerase family)